MKEKMLLVRENRGQIFTWDLVFATSLFMITLGSIIYLWEATISEIQDSEKMSEMGWTAATVIDQIIRTPGTPYDWTISNVSVYGLAEVDTFMGADMPKERILDPDKLLLLIDATEKNYLMTRRRLLGSSLYEFYMELSCLNSSKTDCFDKLPLDYVDYSVSCKNGFNFSVSGQQTNSVVWIEAEDPQYWGNPTTISIGAGCSLSGGNGSMVDSQEAKTVSTFPSSYAIWVRSYDDIEDRSYQLEVNGIPSGIFGNHITDIEDVCAMKWDRIGVYGLGPETSLKFVGTSKTLIDALLLTTDPNYNPQRQGNIYGNPRSEEYCLIGNYTDISNIANIVSESRTAVLSEKINESVALGSSSLPTRMVKLKLVLWNGLLQAQEPNITVNGTGRIPIYCYRSPSENISHSCSVEYNSTRRIDSVEAPSYILCGNTTQVVVNWTGWHNKDPNYCGFFIKNDTYYIGSCMSNEWDKDNTSYTMRCSVTIPSNLSLTDGNYPLIVTAEDVDGYCNPSERGADAVNQTYINLVGCSQRIPIECGPYSGGTGACMASYCCVNSIDGLSINGVESNPNVNCNEVYNVTVNWTGSWDVAGRAKSWGFFIDNSSFNVGKCSTTGDDPIMRFYTMNCSISVNSSMGLPNGIHNLIVTGDSGWNVCNPNEPNLDAQTEMGVNLNNCG